MDLSWKTILTILYGTLILRVAGRKSLSQMTVAQTVVMLAVGTVLIEPLVGRELSGTFAVVTIAVLTLVLIEYLEIRIPLLKKIFTGEPVLLIEDGNIRWDNLKRVRVTVQQLEMELRQAGIASAEEVEWGTIEPNGQFGFLVKEEFQTVNKRDYEYLLSVVQSLAENLVEPEQQRNKQKPREPDFGDNVFHKVATVERKRRD
ncbi:putative membrane protein [Propionispora sp. 2/2-37]|uniref:DUF421 domain-containing protein n=1 Tax=Propionispora sp. 2/2-37 TaxID=1677858 RepID=UPI0006BB5864|nr:DUF421 domain-containing protein [Propionispora sp. 2/2-37]CUH96553.1 putative membrane protein [Propionispora sp. 2/2-37]